MFPIMIVTFLASTYMAMMSPQMLYNDALTDGPSRSAQRGSVAKADDYGADLALFSAGIQNLVAKMMLSPQGRIDLGEEMTAGGGQWVVTWGNLLTFLSDGNGRQYRETLVVPGVPTGDQLRASLFQPGYTPRGPWRALLVQRQVGGVGVNDLNALFVYADITQPGFVQASADAMNLGAVVGGMQRVLKNSALVGRVGAAPDRALIARGYVANNTMSPETFSFSGGAAISGIPAVIPEGAPVHVRCMRGSTPATAFCG